MSDEISGEYDLGLTETNALKEIFEKMSEHYMFEDFEGVTEKKFDLMNAYEALHDIYREFSEQI